MATYVRDHGYSTVECFVGHGIGRDMHEDPQVPNFPSRSLRGSGDFRIEPGLVIAVEPMVNMGTKRVKMLSDHWTQVTADGKPSAHFEHTVAITADGPALLTVAPDAGGAGEAGGVTAAAIDRASPRREPLAFRPPRLATAGFDRRMRTRRKSRRSCGARP